MTEEREPVLVAITGGIGSGKSTVAKFIKEMGFFVISTDDLAKEEFTNPDIIKKLINNFGNEVMKDNHVDHKYLSNKVFGPTELHAEKLAVLNSIIHPNVIDKMTSKLEELVNIGEKLIFVESALIYEAALDEGFDYIIAVATPEQVALQRAIERTGLTKQEIMWRVESQLPAKVKEDYADFTINNDGTLDELKEATSFIIDILKELIG